MAKPPIVAAFFLVLAALFVTPAAWPETQDRFSVFGIRLGEKLALPRCREAVNVQREMYVIPINEPGKLPVYTLRFANDRSPEPYVFRSISTYLHLLNGRVAEVTVRTFAKSQAEVAKILTRKYGVPTAFKTVTKQNAYGARIKAIDAEWHLNGLWVSFDGASDLTSGTIIIETQAALDHTRRQLEQRRKGSPRF